MEYGENNSREIDLLALVDDFLVEAKRLALLGILLILVCSIGLAGYQRMNYYPIYEANAAFTVRVANPLFGSVSSYNSATAEQMAKTFPYILTGDLLKERVMQYLDLGYMPGLSVTASANSNIITLSVRDSDPQRAKDVLDAVLLHYPEIAEFVVGPTKLILLDESGVPTAPVNPFSYRSGLARGAVVGAAIWVLLAGLLALTKSTVHNEEELRQLLSCECLGQIPEHSSGRKDACPVIHKGKQDLGFAEAIRLLRLRMEKQMGDQRKILLVSSAIPGEGKTTVSVNLAVSLAKKGKRVLLIDCDLRNPSVAKALKIRDDRGLSDYLAGTITVREMIHSTEVENLYVAPCGSGVRDKHAELLSQDRTGKMILACRKLFDCVILDTPPCSMLADAAELASLADFGLMVIRHDYASREQILDGAQRLGEWDLQLLGCVLNKMQHRLSSGYGYSYGYGYGYGEKKR